MISYNLKADLLLIVVTLLAAAGWIFSKEALNGFTPLFFIGGRFLLAGLFLSMFCWFELKQLGRRGLLRTGLVGLVFGIAMMSWIMGLQHTSHLGIGAFLTSLGVVLVPLVALFFGERPSREIWLALPLAAAGLACLSLDNAFVIGRGEVAFLIAAVLFAVYFNLNSRAAQRTSAIALTAIQLTVVGLVALAVSGGREDWDVSQPLQIWGWLLASILIATSLRFFIQTWAQGLASASRTAVIMTLEPVWTALIAIWWFDEGMTLLQLLGCALIFAALLLNRYRALLIWVKDKRVAVRKFCLAIASVSNYRM